MQRPIIQKGTILIARPTLLTDVFHRSVVLITDHSETGSIGFVLNKSFEVPVIDFLNEIKSNDIVYEGGPVDQENLFYLHSRPDLIMGSEKIKDGLYWSGNFEDVLHSVNNGYIQSNEIRFYLGYSGWTTHQLEQEIENNAWNVVNDVNFDIFQNWDNDLWQKQMQRLGGDNLLWSNMPENPALN
ncbi:YqgE/AlgH family protein [Flavobacteriaceae bacterium Ap0902]|nr:YqgE/AlgH family protein [Flavobacteriaceae bacterium Ap0902]